AFDCGMRSPDLNDEIDYIPHFHRVYISGAEKSGVSMVRKENEYFADSSLLRVSFHLGRLLISTSFSPSHLVWVTSFTLISFFFLSLSIVLQRWLWKTCS